MLLESFAFAGCSSTAFEIRLGDNVCKECLSFTFSIYRNGNLCGSLGNIENVQGIDRTGRFCGFCLHVHFLDIQLFSCLRSSVRCAGDKEEIVVLIRNEVFELYLCTGDAEVIQE